MRQIMSGKVSPVLIAALTVGLRVKKETIGEIAAAAQVMREFSTKVDVRRPRAPRRHRAAPAATRRTRSTSRPRRCSSRRRPARASPSTAAARCRRSRAAPTCSRRSAPTSRCTPEQVARVHRARRASASCSRPTTTRAMKHAAPVRKELGMRTIFNILGPLTNPAGAPNQVMGVFHPDLVGIQVRVLQRLGSRARARRATASDGLDEVVARRRDDGRRAEGRQDHRVRDPSRGLRPAR